MPISWVTPALALSQSPKHQSKITGCLTAGQPNDYRQKVNLGRGRRPTNLAGPYFLRYSLADGTRPWEAVGDDLDSAIDAQKRKQAYLDANVPVIPNQDETGRTKITDAVYRWFAELQLFQGKDQQGKSEKTL